MMDLPTATSAEELVQQLIQAKQADPASFAPYPNGLALELVLNPDIPLMDILKAYEISPIEFQRILQNPVFRTEYDSYKADLKRDGWSFRQKAKAQAEELLHYAWQLAINPQTPSNVRLETIRSVVKWAQLEAPSPAQQTNVLVNVAGSNGTTIEVSEQALKQVKEMSDEEVERAALSIIGKALPSSSQSPTPTKQYKDIIDIQAEKLMSE